MDFQRRQRKTILSGCLLVLTLICSFLPVKSVSSRRHLVCIYRNDTATRDKGYRIENIATDLCTHVLYDGSRFPFPWEDPTDMMKIEYQKFADIKNQQPNVKLLMNVNAYYTQRMIAPNDTRKMVIESAIRFLRQYNVDGIVYSSVYYTHELIERTKKAFKSAGHDTWTVSMWFPGTEHYNTHVFDMQRICRVADFVILEIDRNSFSLRTDIPSPLYQRSFDTGFTKHFTIMDATQDLINRRRCPRDKILLKVFFRGKKFELADASDHGVHAVTNGRYGQTMDYDKTCSLLQEAGWTVDWDERSRTPFAYRDKEWIGYENEVSLEEKANFVDDEGLGGLVVDSIDQDDYKGVCGKKYPLLTALWKAYKPTWSTDHDPFAFAIFRTTKHPSRTV